MSSMYSICELKLKLQARGPVLDPSDCETSGEYANKVLEQVDGLIKKQFGTVLDDYPHYSIGYINLDGEEVPIMRTMSGCLVVTAPSFENEWDKRKAELQELYDIDREDERLDNTSTGENNGGDE